MIGHNAVHVVEPEHFAKKPWIQLSTIPWERGERWYNNLCKNCHTLGADDSGTAGPTWKGIWGRKWEAVDGASAVPSNAVTQSKAGGVMHPFISETIVRANA